MSQRRLKVAFAVAEVSRHGRVVSAPSAIRFSGVAPQRRAGSVGTLTDLLAQARAAVGDADRKSTRLNSSH